jgi:uncharacterized membrane protein
MKKIQDVSRSIEINATADSCYTTICDIPGFRDWFKHVKSMDIKQVDGEARPSRVFFTFDLLIKKGMKIVLDYRYDDDDRKLLFRSAGGDVSNASGNFHFRTLPDNRTLFVFSLRVDFGMLLPETIVEFLSGRVLDDFVVMVRDECERRSGLSRKS